MGHWPLKKKVYALTAVAAMAVALFLGVSAIAFVKTDAQARTVAARAHLNGLWERQAAALAEGAVRIGRRAEIAHITERVTPRSGLALTAMFAGAFGRGMDDRDRVLVTRSDGTLAYGLGRSRPVTETLPPVHRALAGEAASGLYVVAGQVMVLAVQPLYLPGAKRPSGALLVGRVVDADTISRWQRRIGGTLRFDINPQARVATPTGPLPAWHIGWRPNAGGPVAYVTLPVDILGPLKQHAVLLLAELLAGIALLLWAARLGRAIFEPVKRLEQHVTDAAAGREPEPMPVEGDTEFGRIAGTVNHLAGVLSHREKQCTESARRLDALLEHMVDAVMLFDRTGRVREANIKAIQLTGLTRDALLTRDLVSLVPDERRWQEAVYKHFTDCLDGHTRTFETRLKGPRGSVIPVEINAGRITGLERPMVQAVIRDISTRKRLEAQLVEAEKMEGIGQLAGGIAHDFNNILGGILGYASLIKSMEHTDERLYRYADIIERSATRASDLTQQLLGYARGGKYQVKRIRPNDIIDEVAQLMRGTMAERGITIDTRLDTHLPAIEADAGQLHQVLTNLCINARDAMANGGRLRLLSETVTFDHDDPARPADLPPGRYVRLTVADTGEGMTPEVKRRMFEPYFSTKPQGSGSGLGLAMVYGIVKNHGGQITVASRPGHGTAIRLYLPALAGTMRVLESVPVPRTDTPPASRETVLVVDDEATLLELAREILTQQGYGVILAKDGEEAVSLMREHKGAIPLVLLDIVMPRMGGRETYRALKQIDPAIRVIVSSGFSRHGQAQDLLEAGADGFVQKPYTPEALLKAVRDVLDRPRSPGDSEADPTDGQSEDHDKDHVKNHADTDDHADAEPYEDPFADPFELDVDGDDDPDGDHRRPGGGLEIA